MAVKKIEKTKLEELYEKMLLIRKFEEQVEKFYARNMVHGVTHLYIGEEAVATGVCSALEDKDLITSTHRGHGHCIAKGIDLNAMMAEFLGKQTGLCKGKGGSMHIADLDRGNLGANGIVGGGQPIAVGAGLTASIKGEDNIVVCFFGDAATNTGTFHESLNMASIWKLPILFVCENNRYGISMCIDDHMNIEDISKRAAAYGIKGKRIDGNDVVEVYNAAVDARKHVLKNGPMLLVCDTYRHRGHSRNDAGVYRSKEEVESWKKKDPIKRMSKYLLENSLMSQTEIDKIDKHTTGAMDKAALFAEQSEYPPVEAIFDDVYA